MATAIYKLVAGSYHDWKGSIARGSLVVSEIDLVQEYKTKFRRIQIEHLNPNEIESYKEAVDRFCEVKIIQEHGKFNVVGSDGIPTIREWTTEAKAKAEFKKLKGVMDNRKASFYRMLDRVIPIIEREEEHNSLELDEEFEEENEGNE